MEYIIFNLCKGVSFHSTTIYMTYLGKRVNILTFKCICIINRYDNDKCYDHYNETMMIMMIMMMMMIMTRVAFALLHMYVHVCLCILSVLYVYEYIYIYIYVCIYVYVYVTRHFFLSRLDQVVSSCSLVSNSYSTCRRKRIIMNYDDEASSVHSAPACMHTYIHTYIHTHICNYSIKTTNEF